MPRYSAVFIVGLLPYRRSPMHKPTAKRHLVGDSRQAFQGGGLRHAGNLKKDHARLDDRGPVFRLPFAFAHARFGGDGSDRLMRKDPDIKPAFTAHKVSGG